MLCGPQAGAVVMVGEAVCNTLAKCGHRSPPVHVSTPEFCRVPGQLKVRLPRGGRAMDEHEMGDLALHSDLLTSRPKSSLAPQTSDLRRRTQRQHPWEAIHLSNSKGRELTEMPIKREIVGRTWYIHTASNIETRRSGETSKTR